MNTLKQSPPNTRALNDWLFSVKGRIEIKPALCVDTERNNIVNMCVTGLTSHILAENHVVLFTHLK